MSTTTTAHSAPPEVTIEGRGQWGDIPVLTLDLEAGTIARSMVRQLAKALAHPVNGAYWLRIIADASPGSEQWVDRLLDAAKARAVFQLDLSHDAAQALYDELGRALEVAETTCTQSGCEAIGTLDGQCPAHTDRADVIRIGGAA